MMYGRVRKGSVQEQRQPISGHWALPTQSPHQFVEGYSCTGCYKLRNEVTTERVYLLIENYIQTPPADPTHSGGR